MQVIIIIITMLILGLVIYYVGYLAGGFNSDNQCEDEIAGLKKQLSFCRSQYKQAIKEIEILRGFISSRKGKYLPTKQITRAEEIKEYITELYKRGMTNKQISEELGTSVSMIQRATRKWGLRDKYGKGRSGRR